MSKNSCSQQNVELHLIRKPLAVALCRGALLSALQLGRCSCNLHQDFSSKTINFVLLGLRKLNPHMKLNSQSWQIEPFARHVWLPQASCDQSEILSPPQGSLSSQMCGSQNCSLSQSFFTFANHKSLVVNAAGSIHPCSIIDNCLRSDFMSFQIVSWKHRLFLVFCGVDLHRCIPAEWCIGSCLD